MEKYFWLYFFFVRQFGGFPDEFDTGQFSVIFQVAIKSISTSNRNGSFQAGVVCITSEFNAINQYTPMWFK